MRWSVGPLVVVSVTVAGAQDGATFTFPPDDARLRIEAVDEREFNYTDDYFIDLFSYRPRISVRWRYDDYWETRALAYMVTGGSVTSSESFMDQRGRIRFPFADWHSGEFNYLDTEDYDSRFDRAEVEVIARLFRPEGRPSLTDHPFHTPAPDGLFFGVVGVSEQFKAFSDMGITIGYRGHVTGLRLDLMRPLAFFDDKNKFGGEVVEDPTAIRLEGKLRLLNERIRARAWGAWNLPSELAFLSRAGGTSFDFEQMRAGFDLGWTPTVGFRLDLNVWLERTRKRRLAVNAVNVPGLIDPIGESIRLRREALRFYLTAEQDVPSLLGDDSSRPFDVVFGGIKLHLLDERTDRIFDPRRDLELGREEFFVELGYVLGIPNFSLPETALGVHVSGLIGSAWLTDQNPDVPRDRDEDQTLLAKLTTALELLFGDGRARILLNLTWRLDKPKFGGGNIQASLAW